MHMAAVCSGISLFMLALPSCVKDGLNAVWLKDDLKVDQIC